MDKSVLQLLDFDFDPAECGDMTDLIDRVMVDDSFDPRDAFKRLFDKAFKDKAFKGDSD